MLTRITVHHRSVGQSAHLKQLPPPVCPPFNLGWFALYSVLNKTRYPCEAALLTATATRDLLQTRGSAHREGWERQRGSVQREGLQCPTPTPARVAPRRSDCSPCSCPARGCFGRDARVPELRGTAVRPGGGTGAEGRPEGTLQEAPGLPGRRLGEGAMGAAMRPRASSEPG